MFVLNKIPVWSGVNKVSAIGKFNLYYYTLHLFFITISITGIVIEAIIINISLIIDIGDIF